MMFRIYPPICNVEAPIAALFNKKETFSSRTFKWPPSRSSVKAPPLGKSPANLGACKTFFTNETFLTRIDTIVDEKPKAYSAEPPFLALLPMNLLSTIFKDSSWASSKTKAPPTNGELLLRKTELLMDMFTTPVPLLVIAPPTLCENVPLPISTETRALDSCLLQCFVEQ